MRRLDDNLDPPEAVSDAQTDAHDGEIDDAWFELDLWPSLLAARGWLGRTLTTREERQLGRDYSSILSAENPAAALAGYRNRHQ